MERLLERLDLDEFFARLATAEARVLFLDYDGTIAPFCRDRSEATPFPGVRRRLEQLLASGETRLVIVTGRSVAELLPLLGLSQMPEIWGCHGGEHLDLQGNYRLLEIPDGAEEAFNRGFEALRARFPHLSDRIERKPAGIAIHTRGVPEEQASSFLETARQTWTELAQPVGLMVRTFDGGLELRVSGRDKGAAVRHTLAELSRPFAAAYLGDDLTDEDAFRALSGAGLCVLVRSEPRETVADLRITPPDEVLEFLDRWQQLTAGEGEP